MSFYVQPKQIMLANFLFPIIQKYKQSQDLICYGFYNVGNSYKNITRIFHGISYSVKFSHSLVSDSPRPHGLQHSRLPCPSPSPGACSNSYPLSQWCYPTILSSVIPFSSCLQSFPASGSFLMTMIPQKENQKTYINRRKRNVCWTGSLHQVDKVLELQLQHQSF